MKKNRTAQSAFFNQSGLFVFLLCAAAACSLVSRPLLAFFHSDTPTKDSHPAGAGLTFAKRVAYQRAIEEVYWQHRIWPRSRGENSKPKPSFDEVMSAAQIEKKVEDYLRDSQALEDYWQRPITSQQLQAEMDRMAKHTKQPEVLHELFATLGNNPFVIAECLARPVLTQRLVADPTVVAGVSPAPRNLYGAHTHSTSLRAGSASTENRINATNLNKATYTLPEIDPCIDDAWTATSTTNAPDGRQLHTAVWTGSEMIVWGGTGNPKFLNTGGRYNPSTNTWTATSTTDAPAEREDHTAAWTGSEMIVWGGDNSLFLNTGGRYNPNTDSWTATSNTNAPTPRSSHTAVWTGTEMIVWGGSPGFNTGGRYNPGTDSWTATSTTNVPQARVGHTAVWTSSEMIIWGGYAGGFNFLNTGGRYNPSNNTWTATSLTNAPSARELRTAVWTDSEMIVWGGSSTSVFNTGGRYNPSTDGWTVTSTISAPDGRENHTAVWTGSEMIVWGGNGNGGISNTGGRYCAQSGAPSPTPTATPCASVGSWTERAPYPIAVSGHAVVSQGGNVYSFGGIGNNVAIANAYKYTPATNTWTPIASLPQPRGWFSGTTDGTYIYLLGGVDQNFTTTATLWRYDPISNTYNTSLPSYTIPTYFHASAYLNGKIYRIAGRAIGTDFHVEVYTIATNTWSMAANYPFANHSLMAAALGNYIYAGGGNASPDKTWRYDPGTNTWDDAAIADLPAGRSAAASGAYNGRWLLAGGDVNFAISTSAIAWDPATNTWSDLAIMVQARDYLGGATAGQSFYAVAGSSAPGAGSDDNQQYTETPCGTPTATPTATPSSTLPPSPTPTATFTPTPTPTATASSTPTATATTTATSTATPTSTPRPSPTPRIAPTARSRPTPAPRP